MREEIHSLLCNKLTYPKALLGILRKGELSEERLFKMQELIDESIRAVDLKFSDLIGELES